MSSSILKLHPRCSVLVNTSEYTLWRAQAQLSFSWYESKIILSEDIDKVKRTYLVFNMHSNHRIFESFTSPVVSGYPIFPFFDPPNQVH